MLSNIERVINLNTRKIYGNAFANATETELTEACQYLHKPQLVNLIAIEAPSYGHGLYSFEQIQFILITAFTGFKAARLLAKKTRALNLGLSSVRSTDHSPLRTVIHTGWWGCGAYGNNRQMMILTQILAAHWAGIDELIFHVQNEEYRRETVQARNIATTLLSETKWENVIEQIRQLRLQWEKSNNT